MKAYNDLTNDEKARAHAHCLNRLVRDISDRRIRFNDALNDDDFQARIDKIWEAANVDNALWFVDDYLLADEYVRDILQGMAQCEAEDALYSERHEQVLHSVLS